MNKVIGIGELIAVGVAVFTGIMGSSFSESTVDNLYTLSGFGMVVFGVWAAIILIREGNKQ